MITNLVSHETTHFGNQTVSVEEKQGKVNEGKVHSERGFILDDSKIALLR